MPSWPLSVGFGLETSASCVDGAPKPITVRLFAHPLCLDPPMSSFTLARDA